MPHPRSVAALVAVALATPLVAAPPAQAVTPQVSWTDTTAVAGDRVRATVALDTRPRGTRLVLQRKYLDTWRKADGTAQRNRRGFVLEVPTDQYGTFDYRVVAKDGRRTVATSRTRAVEVRPPYAPVGRPAQHRLTTGGDGHKIRWDPCAGAITWTFNPRHAPTRGLKQLKAGFRRIQRATGLELEYAGTTGQKPNPFGQGIRNGADLIVGWRTARDYDLFDDHPQVVGEGGNTHRYGFREADGTATSKAISGGVVLNASRDRRLANGFGRGYTWGEVIIHEIGHVLGLSHTGSPQQVMYFQTIRRDADWGAGDLRGLRRVGDSRGCLDRGSGRASSDRLGTTADVTFD
ncbi:MAG TPA: matrixin family metalloprotease [Marmoricola sp.]|nr:matrixin family metalloprotease [Marmoricola sp.]